MDTIKNKEQSDEAIYQNIELLTEQLQSEEGDLSSLTNHWDYLKKHPLNLNTADREALSELGMLDEIQINNFIKHREKNGNLITLYELQSIAGFDIETIKSILPFIYVRDQFHSAHFNRNELFKYGRHEFVTRYQRVLEKQIGYLTPDSITKATKPNSFYLGNKDRYFARYSFQYNNNVSFVLAGEKDAGEQFFKGTQKQGFDFYTGHVAIKNIRNIKSLVVGDYQASFGQGLTLWNGFAFGKSASQIGMKRSATGIKAYQSFDENRFFRGLAGTVKIKKFDVTGLVSYKKIDGNVTQADTLLNGDIEANRISSLSMGGLHNTNATMQDKGSVLQTIFGGNVTYRHGSLQIGLTGQQMNLSAELVKTPTLYNAFDFQGKSNFVGGVDYNYVIKNMNLFGEVSKSASGGNAICQGMIVALDPKLTFIGHYRNFDRNFQNLFGNGISENTFSQNEKGIYLGAEAKLFKSLCLSVYVDQYKFSWLQYNKSAPSLGRDIFAQLTYAPSKKIEMYVRCRQRYKFENSTIQNRYDYLVPLLQYNYRYHLSVQITPSVKLKSRVEFTAVDKYQEQDENGVVFSQDIIYKQIKIPFSITCRYALFDTKSYASRIYGYENDILYGYSVPALYYKGQRVYLMINWNITRKIEMWIRVSQTLYDNQNILLEGSLNQINGNSKTELKLQLKCKL